MKKPVLFIFTLLLVSLCTFAASDSHIELSYENETFGGVELNYRKAEINSQTEAEKIVVVYLHGGSGQGDDNEAQVDTPAVDDICNYLKNNGFNAVFVAPQAPAGSQWEGTIMEAVKALLDKYSGKGTSRVYVLGGSMGGYGVWNMLTAYQGYFTGSMPVACNTPRNNPDKYLSVRIISVVGGNDAKRNIRQTKSFFEEFATLGGEALFEVEDNWNHRKTCDLSFTPERLKWLFGKSDTAEKPLR